MIWSILLLTTPRRCSQYFAPLQDKLVGQIGKRYIEVLALYDNKKRTVGEKRNILLGLARGQYVSFIDDDDRITDDYVETIALKIKENPDVDVIVFQVEYDMGGVGTYRCHYSVDFDYRTFERTIIGRPKHIHVWRRELVSGIRFLETNVGEDSAWETQAHPLVKREISINRVLYYYDYNPMVSETRGRYANS